MEKKLKLRVLKDVFAVCKLDIKESIPEWALKSEYFSITKTDDELSIVCEEKLVPKEVKSEGAWRCFKVEGVLDFSLVGILSKLSKLMAKNGISIFAISTYNTDYLLVKDIKVNTAIKAFIANGYELILAK